MKERTQFFVEPIGVVRNWLLASCGDSPTMTWDLAERQVSRELSRDAAWPSSEREEFHIE
jgi:hypothetical protein